MSEASSSVPAASLEVLNLAQQGVRVEFRWMGDRFSHTIVGVCQGEAVPLLESIEGTAEDSLPPSPALVELHQQDEAMFLTGACAAGHWSMSVEVAETPSRLPGVLAEPADRLLLFDVACRLREGVEGLGSRYQGVGTDTHCVPADEWVAAANEAGFSVVVGPHLLKPPIDCKATCEGGQADSNRICIAPAVKDPKTFPATVRWKYGVFWALN